ncbi:MAG: cytochrome B, partial [Alphaproteobacteria bacterium]|nr:cytochrome B [Alphaproteobacteria bacterium]
LLLGVANTWVRGDDIFGLFHIPFYGSYDKASRHALSEAIVHKHALLANIILLLAGAHALMGLIHHYILRDNVLMRMLPRRN